jgi:ferredoxin-NADP reductase
MSKYKILQIEHITDSTFRFRAERSSSVIKAGQCFNVGVAGTGINREYSLYSGINSAYVEFLIKEIKGGIVSPALKNLQTNDYVEIDGPYGNFCLEEPIDIKKHYLFLATGTGIAPFHSFVQTYPNLNYTILHGIRYPHEQYDINDYTPGRYIPCISNNINGQPSCRLTEYLRQNPANPNSTVYLCGNRNMIIDAYEIVLEQGISTNNIFTEVFF